MVRALRRIASEGLVGDQVWHAVQRHGPAGYNVIEGLLRRGLIGYIEGNQGATLRITDKGQQWIADDLEG